ncbi:hypothetical protein [Methylorubrum extorquens]|uniref:hypothetical protein n=1 Tax=Methylorubrum extorquens TaxID=408 RepID=UPI0011BF0984|nr:hypothetical protein [Methylorubrum extorquens]
MKGKIKGTPLAEPAKFCAERYQRNLVDTLEWQENKHLLPLKSQFTARLAASDLARRSLEPFLLHQYRRSLMLRGT